jgi:N-formylglutamate amidohydrolase
MRHRLTLLAALLLLAPLAALHAAAPAADPVPVSAVSGAGDDASNQRASSNATITVAAGGLPIILSAPHGGRAAIPGVPERKGDGAARFNPRTDTNTDILTEKLADALERKLGKRPYVVIARFHRKYIDANRRPQDAFESAQAKPTYEAYHAAIASACKEVTARWGRGIVLDIHGQASQPGVVFRGTQNGKTVAHLLSRSGREAVFGETSLLGQLAKQGFAVFPPVGSSDREGTNYTGGHIVGTHGSSSGGTIDAIQLELGTKYRDSKTIEDVTDKLANAITAFAKSYLPTEEKKPVASDASKRTGTIGVGVYLDKGTGPSVNDLLRALSKFDQVSVTKLTAEQIRSGGLAGLDILMHPGGSGGEQGRNLDEPGREKIRNFVREGGGFIGICAGAYLATAQYPWSLNILDAKVIDPKHWRRGIGTVDIELTPAGREILRTTNQNFPIHYAQGPLMAPANRPEIDDYEEMANFKTEIAKNGAPEGVMIGTTAIARGRFGMGRVICFSPHPEMTAGLESFVQDAIDYVNRKRAGKFQ